MNPGWTANARESAHSCDFAVVAILGLLGLRIFAAAAADIAGLGEELTDRRVRPIRGGHLA
jgi:integrase/recombinase XerD